MTNNPLRELYEAIPYPNYTFSHTQPNHIAVVATILGLKPAPVNRCRYLELGCAQATNLIPLASLHPESEFVGIDLTPQSIETAQADIARLNLKNIRVEVMDLLEVAPDFGKFDYIVAHGLYSWIPVAVRDKLLAICKANLSPQGVAYVSYNTYPGWHLFNIFRDIMRYHGRDETTLQGRINKARTTIQFLIQAIPRNHPYGSFIGDYLKMNWVRDDALLIHDKLADINDPVYFHQFMDHAHQHGLQYLAEAQFSTVMPNKFPLAVQKKLHKMSQDVIEMEQYLDYLFNRSIRQTFLCHAEATIDRLLDPTRVMNFYSNSQAHTISKIVNLGNGVAETFESKTGVTVTLEHGISKAALMYLQQRWPQSFHFNELFAVARETVAPQDRHPNPEVDKFTLARSLLLTYTQGRTLLDFLTERPTNADTIEPYPLVMPVTRWQATQGEYVSNLYHDRVQLSKTVRFLLPFLDGQHSQADLLEKLIKWVQAGNIEVDYDGQAISDTPQLQVVLPHVLRSNLQWLVDSALLVGNVIDTHLLAETEITA